MVLTTLMAGYKHVTRNLASLLAPGKGMPRLSEAGHHNIEFIIQQESCDL